MFNLCTFYIYILRAKGSGGMAQWLDHLLCRQEDKRADPWSPRCQAYNSRLRKGDGDLQRDTLASKTNLYLQARGLRAPTSRRKVEEKEEDKEDP